ncbi:MAG: YaeQ family protein, partial [Mycolicibacterium aromaticivorans]|nr:YaeQ family protein [Mycolicibacterium aromaticivorans]
VATWWRTVGPKVAGLPNLSVLQIPHAPVQLLAHTVDRRVSAQVMVMEGQVTMTVGDVDVTFTPEPLK